MNKDLTLAEFHSLKLKLDKDIFTLLEGFNVMTGLIPESVELHTAYNETFGNFTNTKYLINATTTFVI